MVRFFDKLKKSFRKTDPSTPPADSPTPHPAPETPAAAPPNPTDTALATASPARVTDATPSQTSPETVPEPSSPSVIVKRTSRVKRSRVRVHRTMRPRPVIRESQVTDRADPPSIGANPEPIPTPEPLVDREKAVSSPEPVVPSEDRENGEASPEPVTAQEESEKPASNAKHVISRTPIAQKRRRNIRVVKPKVRVIH